MTAYYNEIDPYAANWLRNLISAGLIAPGDVDERSIADVRPDDLRGYTQCHFFAGIGVWSHALRLAGWSDDQPVWTGSCPCQPFSAAGAGAGFDDERHLWPAWYHLIGSRRPPVVFGEQVASPNGYLWLDLVQADLEGAAYTCGPVVLPAAGFGAPHGRHRIFYVAHAAGGGQREQRSETEPGRERHADCGHSVGELAEGGQLQEPFRGSQGRDGIGSARKNDPDAAVSGFWFGADWIYCRDERWRPVEPGTFPLVDGASFNVGSGSAFEGKSRAKMLRGYGNAIVPQVAAEFIGAYMSARNVVVASQHPGASSQGADSTLANSRSDQNNGTP